MKCFFYTYQEGLGAPFALYQLEVSKGLTTVTAQGLEERGIPVPPTPSYEAWKREPEQTIHIRNVGYILAKMLVLLLALLAHSQEYRDGCEAGEGHAHYDFRHEALYNAERRFWVRDEWDKGYANCYRDTAGGLVQKKMRALRKLKVVM